MSGLTSDPNHPDIKRGGPDESPVPQNKVYLVLSEQERAKGFLLPYRSAYIHNRTGGPRYPLRDLTDEEKERYAHCDYDKYEEYPPGKGGVVGRFWSAMQLDMLKKPCGAVTTMGRSLSETYAVDPWFYSATYCVGCRMHRPLDEFSWISDDEPMDPALWSDETIKHVVEAKKKRDGDD